MKRKLKYVAILFNSICVHLSVAQVPISQVEGYLEVYHPQDTTSMYIGNESGQYVEIIDTMRNIVIGNESGDSIKMSRSNIVLGHRSGKKLYQSDGNILIGNEISARYYTEDLNDNVVIGHRAAFSLYEGTGNTLIGSYVGHSLSSSSFNTIMGASAGEHVNGLSYGNTFYGFSSGTNVTYGSENNFFGLRSGFHSLGGDGNSFFGYRAGYNNTEGHRNIFIGNKAGERFTTGIENIVLGGYTGQNTLIPGATGTNNILIGNDASVFVQEASDNVVIGGRAGNQMKNGKYNTMIGTESGIRNNDGNYNTYLGYHSGAYLRGDGNITIGKHAGPNGFEEADARLYIDIIQSDRPLIYGEFDKDFIVINGLLKSEEFYFQNQNTDDGVISADTSYASSDLFLKSNDKVIIDLDGNDDENSTFSVRDGAGTTILNLEENGNLTVDGTLIHTSDINRKHGILPVNPADVLDKLRKLEISSWKYKGTDTKHIGPMAQDFFAAFGYGGNERTISTVDADGVALAAIKALAKENQELHLKIESQNALIQRVMLELEILNSKL